MRTTIVAFVLAGALGLGSPARAADPAWIHVEVKDARSGDSRINVNLPFALVDIALNAVDEGARHGRVHLDHGHGDLGVTDLRRMWTELKRAGDTPFVTVEKEDESVRLERRGTHMLLEVSDKRNRREKVHMDVPTSVIDALLSGEGDTLNLTAAASELRRSGGGELIRIDDEDSHVRVWLE